MPFIIINHLRVSEFKDEGFPFFAERFQVWFIEDFLEGVETGGIGFGVGDKLMIVLYQ